MKKRELLKIRSLKATKTMKELSVSDKPYRKEGYRDTLAYKYGLYMRCHVQDGILKTAIFFAEHLRAGAYSPAYEIFVEKETKKFVTYDRLLDRWLDSKLDRLDLPFYTHISDEKWINPSDDKIIREYLSGEKGGFDGLLDYQRHIRHEELMKRHKKVTDPWDADLEQISPLPKDWERWISKVGVQENYIFYKYDKKGVTSGYCTFCEKDVPIKNPKYGEQKKCPRCRHTATLKSVGKAGTVITKDYNMYLLQRCNDGFVIRLFYANRIYRKGEYTTPECRVYEIRRAVYGSGGETPRAYYWGLYKQKYWRWIIDSVRGPGSWKRNGMVYGKTIPSLAKSELSRTGLTEFIKTSELSDPEIYLAMLDKAPQIEKFSKAGLPQLVYECIDSYYNIQGKLHNANASSLTGMLGIDTQELKRLRQNNGGFKFLDWLRFEKATDKPISDDAVKWFCAEKITPEDIKFITTRMSVAQIYNYIRRQTSVYKDTAKNIIIKWSDYLSMAKRLKMDVNDEIIFRVNKLYQRHDELVERCHEKDIAIRAGEIAENYPHVDEICESIIEKYEYADDDYAVLVPERIEDIIREGNNLHHCLDNSDRYWDRIERRETYILFLRKTSNINKAYYTLEIEPNGTVRQKRTMYDRQEPDIEDANKFLLKWQTVISKRLDSEDRKLADESRELRVRSYAQLRDDRVIINTGVLRGKLLVDVLLADLMENAG